jgi:hypothetical protein
MKKIKSEASQPYFPELTSMKSHLPKWYKEVKPFKDDVETFSNKTMKLCMPFLDSLTAGYAMVLAGDVVVDLSGGLPNFTSGTENLVDMRGLDHAMPPAPPGYIGLSLAWNTKVTLQLPKGYSALITHPLNRFDLPFITSSGIVDDYEMSTGNVPFFIKHGFEGVIEKGTPIAQIIPFKREDWTHEVEEGLAKRAQDNGMRSQSMVSGWYKKNIWKRKTFN